MKHFFAILLAALCAATSYAQTIKTLGFNTTNGQIVAATNVVWTNAFSFSTNVIAAQVRTNLGLPLNTLTNDSNVTLMRALSGSTNTNHPYSGSISVTGTNNTNTLVFSNGILQEVQ